MKGLRMRLLLAAFVAAPLAVQAAEPGPMWGAIPGAGLDPELSQTFYPVAARAYSRMAPPGETAEVAAAREKIARESLLVYLKRVDAMVAGMNLPDDVRREHCARMLTYLSDDFIHLEGRRNVTEDGRGGFATRTKGQLAQACEGRAFLLSGFYATRSRVRVLEDNNTAVVVTCYFHNQWNDPLVRGTTPLPDGTSAVYRASVEVIALQADGVRRIVQHVALDSDDTLVRRGCAVS